MKVRLLTVTAVSAALSLMTTGTAGANEASCANAAAANGYVNANKFLWQVQQDCAVAYSIANAPGGTGSAALAAANQYLRSLGYDADTVEQMDIAGHGI